MSIVIFILYNARSISHPSSIAINFLRVCLFNSEHLFIMAGLFGVINGKCFWMAALTWIYLAGEILIEYYFTTQYHRKFAKESFILINSCMLQVYRLHQLNRAAQLVTALSYTVKGAEMTTHNLAISSSLSTLLNVLHFLGVICIWSLSSFIMRLLPSASISEE